MPFLAKTRLNSVYIEHRFDGAGVDNDKNLFNELRANIEFYYKDLVGHIIYIAQNNYRWSNGRLPGGKKPDDLAQEIIRKILSGERKGYDPSKASLRTWLWMQAESVVDALSKSAIHRREMELPDEFISSSLDFNPESELITKELQEMISKEVNTLFQIADPPLKELIEAVISGDCEPKPRFLAAALGTNITDINNRLKRLRRLAKKGETADE